MSLPTFPKKLCKNGGFLTITKIKKREPPIRELSKLIYKAIYLTVATSALKVSGSFIARSASTLRSRPIPFWLSLWIKAE